jgi:serine/threonine protein phosphatase PrpC
MLPGKGFLRTDGERPHSTKMPRNKTSRHIHTALHNHVFQHPHFIFASRTIACERHIERNEDSILVDKLGGFVAVFDGVGGSAAGEIASQTAAHAASQQWRQTLDRYQKGRRIPTFLERCENLDLCSTLEHIILEADELVRTEGARRAGTNDLATTVALAAFCRPSEAGQYHMIYAHVGDSRIYLLQSEKPLQRLTSDDGLLAKLVENQIINDKDALRIDQAMIADELSDIELSYFKLRGGITQALGGPLAPTIHIDQIPIQPGDRILLCTDGIHDNLTDREIEAILRDSPRTASARILVERSLERSHEDRSRTIRAKPDDMSAIVITCCF